MKKEFAFRRVCRFGPPLARARLMAGFLSGVVLVAASGVAQESSDARDDRDRTPRSADAPREPAPARRRGGEAESPPASEERSGRRAEMDRDRAPRGARDLPYSPLDPDAQPPEETTAAGDVAAATPTQGQAVSSDSPVSTKGPTPGKNSRTAGSIKVVDSGELRGVSTKAEGLAGRLKSWSAGVESGAAMPESSKMGTSAGGDWASPDAAGDPSRPVTRADLLNAAFTGMRGAFSKAGLRVTQGPDGALTILARDGSPASEADLDKLRAAIAAEPAALMKHPDLFAALPRDAYASLKERLKSDSMARVREFKDVGLTEGERDLAWTRTCHRVSGECNPLAAEAVYNADEFVSPRSLGNIWGALGDWAGDEDDGSGAVARARAKAGRGIFGGGAEGLWDRLSRGISGVFDGSTFGGGGTGGWTSASAPGAASSSAESPAAGGMARALDGDRGGGPRAAAEDRRRAPLAAAGPQEGTKAARFSSRVLTWLVAGTGGVLLLGVGAWRSLDAGRAAKGGEHQAEDA